MCKVDLPNRTKSGNACLKSESKSTLLWLRYYWWKYDTDISVNYLLSQGFDTSTMRGCFKLKYACRGRSGSSRLNKYHFTTGNFLWTPIQIPRFKSTACAPYKKTHFFLLRYHTQIHTCNSVNGRMWSHRVNPDTAMVHGARNNVSLSPRKLYGIRFDMNNIVASQPPVG